MVDLNLASRPFLNLKPQRRLGVVLLVAGFALVAWSGSLYWRYFTGQGEARQRSQDLGQGIEAARDLVTELEAELLALDVDALNRQARAVNLEIDRRRFAWSRLFDDLAAVLPPDVRLVSLSPNFTSAAERRRSAPRSVILELRGVARSGEDILALIDGIFDHPAFRDPDLSRESRRADGLVDFVLAADYLLTGQRRSESVGLASAVPEAVTAAADAGQSASPEVSR